MNEMQGKFYDERVIKLFYIPREIYYPNYKKDITPPAIKAPPKKKVEPQLGNLPQISRTSHIATKSVWIILKMFFINLHLMLAFKLYTSG